MRLACFIFAFCFFVAAAAPQNQTPTSSPNADSDKCILAGTVLRKGTDEPIRYARISLQEKNDQDKKPVYAVTGPDGKFSIANILPGQYQIRVSANGYVSTFYGARHALDPGLPFTLSSGQQVTDLVFRLVPAGVIEGRLRDENGEPLPSAEITALLANFNEGQRTLLPASVVQTNDRGEYRLFNLPPGKYLLTATAQQGPAKFFSGFRGVIDADGDEGRGLVTTYYPGAIDQSQAQSLTVEPGSELRSVDFSMQASGKFHVRGHVSGLPVVDPKVGGVEASVVLRRSGNRENLMSFENTAGIDLKDGSFDIRDIAPGAYNLIAMEYSDHGVRLARKLVEVGATDLDGIELAFEAPANISGHVTWDGKPPDSKKSLTVYLKGDEENYSGTQTAEIQADGSFELKGVGADTYSLNVSGDLPDAYLKSAQYGSVNALDPFRTVSGAGPSLDLVLSSRGAHLQGTVMNSDPVPVGNVWVALVPDDPNRKQKRLYHSVRTSADGKFDFRGIAPGDYTLFSWDNVQKGQWFDPDFLKTFQGKGVSITFAEGQSKSADLTILTTKTSNED